MTVEIDWINQLDKIAKRVARLETLEGGEGGGSGGFIREIILDDSVTSEVNIGSIPQSFQHLILMISARAVGVTDSPMYLQFNGDEAANYIWGYRIDATYLPSVGAQNYIDIGDLPGCLEKSDLFCSWEGFIAHYHSTIKKTPITWHSGGLWATGWSDFKGSGAWDNNAGISSIRVYLPGNTFAIHSKFVLYGQGEAAD